MFGFWRRWRAQRAVEAATRAEAAAIESVAACAASCTLAGCLAGDRATVRQLQCTKVDAARLRTLGVYEGALVGIIDRRNGVLLDVCGSRLALDASMADAIVVEPNTA